MSDAKVAQKSVEAHLRTLAEEPSNPGARRAVSKVAARKVGDAFLYGSVEQSPDLAAIAAEILSDNGSHLTVQMRTLLGPIIRSIVDGVLSDDDPSGVSEILEVWSRTGQLDEQRLYEALQVAIGKRIHWVLRSPQFDAIRFKLSPGELMSELFLKFHGKHLPASVDNRYAFFRYAEGALMNYLRDVRRHYRRAKRGGGDPEPLDELIRVLENGDSGAVHGLSPEASLDLARAVDKLPEKLREVIRMCDLWGWGIEDAAEKLAVSRSTVMRDLTKGRLSLSRVLKN
jgi:RNA polymerase sigma factor (sigma-70 family)